MLERVPHELRAGRDPELLHDVRAVRLDRAHREEERLGDLLVRVAERQQPKDLVLPLRQRVLLPARPPAAISRTAATSSTAAASLST